MVIFPFFRFQVPSSACSDLDDNDAAAEMVSDREERAVQQDITSECIRNSEIQGRAKNLAKFSDTCSVRADGLCIGSTRLVGRRKAGNSNMLDFFCTTLYSC